MDAFELCYWRRLGSPLDFREIKLVNPEGNQPWTFIGRVVAEAEAPVLWPPYVKSQLLRKDPDSWKDWRQKVKGMVEDEMVGWHHWLNGLGFEQTPGDGEGQRSLACCSWWGQEETRLSHWTTKTVSTICPHPTPFSEKTCQKFESHRSPIHKWEART